MPWMFLQCLYCWFRACVGPQRCCSKILDNLLGFQHCENLYFQFFDGSKPNFYCSTDCFLLVSVFQKFPCLEMLESWDWTLTLNHGRGPQYHLNPNCNVCALRAAYPIKEPQPKKLQILWCPEKMFWNLVNPLENTRLEFFYHSPRLQTRKITIKNSSTGAFSVAFSRSWISHILAKISFHLQENWTIFFFRSLCHSSKTAKMSETYIMISFQEMLVDAKNNCFSFFPY